jgi:hypothetical protein
LPFRCHDAYPPSDIEQASLDHLHAIDGVAVRSFIFFSAISHLPRYTLPALSRPGAAGRTGSWQPARKWDIGGVFISKVKERSQMVMITRIRVFFSSFCVCALNACRIP